METINGTLFIIDISGYTKFMTKTSLLHAKHVITEILDKIAHQCNAGLILNKVEGDALFFYSEKLDKEFLIEHSKEIHSMFHNIVEELSEKHKVCDYEICHKLDELHIKFLIHSGEFTIHKIRNFEELMGVSVIEAHRLLKNSVAEDSYILVVDENGEHSESYEHIGEIRYNLVKFH